jgi:hypothetical protein
MAYIYNLSDAWNDAGTTFTSIKMNVLDTASSAASKLLDLQVGGSSRFSVAKSGTVIAGASNATETAYGFGSAGLGLYSRASVRLNFAVSGADTGLEIGANVFALASTSSISWASGTLPSSALELTLARDAANTLAQRNGVNAQMFRVYETFTDASNYSRLEAGFDAGNGSFVLRSINAGTGTLRPIALMTSGNIRWSIGATTGHFLAGADNTYDIGASGATRPRNLYMGSWLRMATTTVASLPAAATAGAGARMFVTDALVPVFGSAVAGGGAVTVPVYSTGSAWNVG